MLAKTKDPWAVDGLVAPDPFKYSAAVRKRVRGDVQSCSAPWHDGAVHPNPASFVKTHAAIPSLYLRRSVAYLAPAVATAGDCSGAAASKSGAVTGSGTCIFARRREPT